MGYSTIIRLRLAKDGRARFISHLDLSRTLQRAIKRSGLPVWYTEGFNPRLYMMFPLPLSLGIASECEFMDIRLTENLGADEAARRINDVLPEGLMVLGGAEAVNKHTRIASCVYRITLLGITQEECGKVEELLGKDEINVEKPGKVGKGKGSSTVNIKPMLLKTETAFEEGSLIIEAECTAGTSGGLSPNLVVKAVEDTLGREVERLQIRRMRVFMENGEEFF